MTDLLFPHESIRPSQKDFVQRVTAAIQQGGNLVIHAPTGSGKTAASLAPALTQAINKDHTIFFLTSRHTQHDIALKTLEEIKRRHGITIDAVDVIGKKWMCLQDGVQRLPASEFTEFCRALREDGKCDYYSNLKKSENLTTKGKLVLETLRARSPVRNQHIINESRAGGVCPYYASMELAKKAKVIIGDYFYVFHPKIREQFFARSDNELEDAIIIIDEAHNLPNRIKDLSSARISSLVLKRAVTEARKRNLDETANKIEGILSIVEDYGNKAMNSEKKEVSVSKEDFMFKVKKYGEYEIIKEEFETQGDAIREDAQVSFVGAVGNFLGEWMGPDEGFARIVSLRRGLREQIITLSYRCLDPSLVAKPIIDKAHSTIMMSGTLTPTNMYREVVGFSEAQELVFPSPFPNKNRLNIIVPKTSTKYSARSEQQYKNIASILKEIADAVPGNVAIFFPSYFLLGEVKRYFESEVEKTVFSEQPEMTTSQKQMFIDNFRKYKDIGAVLLGCITGSFGEGIDLPGDELKCVVIVGLPLQKPNIETQELINYYDKKFGKGWDYGYLFPAFNKTLQSAGRCIRSEKDRGVIIFLDERYAWPNYKRCFPRDWEMKISLLYKKMIADFFNAKK